jgi:hypothetical protein
MGRRAQPRRPGPLDQLYEPDRFSGRQDREDKDAWASLTEWKRARAEELARARAAGELLQISVDQLTTRLWTDPGARLGPNHLEVTFIERWKARCCARHGPVTLYLSWNPVTQQLRIVSETRLEHMDGFTDPVVTLSSDAASLDLGKAWAEWRRLPILGENVSAVLQALSAKTATAPQVARGLARAAIARVDARCDRVYGDVDYDDVGEIPAPAPRATLDDPCVGRAVMLWALAQAETLGEADLPAIHAPLEGMLTQDEHGDEELQLAAAHVATRFSEPVRYQLMSKANREARDLLRDTLSLPYQTRAALELHDGGAALHLDPRRQRDAILTLLLDEEIGTGARIVLLRRSRTFSGPDFDETLSALAAAPVCPLAMATADFLARRGDPSALPARSNDEEKNRTALCRLVFDPDRARCLATWRTFLPPRGAATIVHARASSCTRDDEEEKVRQVTRKSAALRDLEDSLSSEACSESSDGPWCYSYANPTEVTVSFAPYKGQLYVSEIRYEASCGAE